MAKNEMLRPLGDTIPGIMPLTVQPLGIAMMIASVDADTGVRTFAVAEGRCDGFCEREVRLSSNLSISEQLYGVRDDAPADGMVTPETPYGVGLEGSIRQSEAIVLEGSDYLVLTGASAIATNTAVGTEISFAAGKACKAVTGQRPWGILVGVLTPEDAGAVRIMVQMLAGPLKP